MLHTELLTMAEPVLDKVLDHPFWSGLRDGSLPPESLGHFVAQDTGHLLPAYARGLARCAAIARHDEHTALLARSITGTLEARERLVGKYDELADTLGTIPLPPHRAAVDPTTQAYSSFFTAAATSLAAGVGALVPMVWFNFKVSNDLLERQREDGRYAPWIEIYHPGEGYQYAVRAFLGLVDAIGEDCSVADRTALIDNFEIAVRYEWSFAETCWQRGTWPV